ncbi:MAG: UDP-N-acetylmuramate--L-alanine ligase [Betaproteobacteria bacterium]|nr:MAG: UDP-N-acetylmuramate--L-alanine ligase [Betaproteobacteria bacterium]
MKFRLQHIHFIGIGGIGMSGIAEVLHNQGYKVSGSDAANSPVLERLKSLGVHTHVGHAAANISGAQAVVTSTAISRENPELAAALAAKIPVVPRALMLAELMRMKRGIAIAGTHGKTTTTSLVASVLGEGHLDPTFVIGGRLLAAGSNARLGTGEFLVAEADESDASFLHLSPTLAVITNIDADHMETYGHSLDRLKQAFVDFSHRLPFYGSVYACIDDEGVASILPKIVTPVVTYGLSETADVRATDVRADGATMRFNVQREGHATFAIQLNAAGMHNVRNALSAVAIGQDLGVDDAAIARALASFGGVGRRFDRYGVITHGAAKFELIDDYGHHPVELKTTLAAARAAFPGRRLVLAFQPHRFTRTRDLFEDFAAVLSEVDVLLLTEVYAAGEAPIVAADGRALARAIRLRGKVEPIFVEDTNQLPEQILSLVKEGDVVMTMGAGSIGTVSAKVTAATRESGGAKRA